MKYQQGFDAEISIDIFAHRKDDMDNYSLQTLCRSVLCGLIQGDQEKRSANGALDLVGRSSVCSFAIELRRSARLAFFA
jgi:hypothetical protein